MFTYDHPSEESLERFLLHAVEGVELVRLEGHILGCEPCIFRLEEIELELAATKLALKNFCWRESQMSVVPIALPTRSCR